MLISKERRRDLRAVMSVPAEVLSRGRRRSFAWLKDLSERGAQLRSAVGLTPGARVRLMLHPSGRPVVGVTATVLESKAGAPPGSFSARLELTVLAADERKALVTMLAAARRPGLAPQDRAVLIIMNDTDARHALAREVAALGRRPVTVSTPLDAIVWLQDATATIDAVVASERYLDLLAFFAFLEDFSPGSRRVLAAERPARRRSRLPERTPLIHAVVTLPAEPDVLAAALAPGRSGTSAAETRS